MSSRSVRFLFCPSEARNITKVNHLASGHCVALRLSLWDVATPSALLGASCLLEKALEAQIVSSYILKMRDKEG